MSNNLFENNGAEFSACRRYRYALWRIWDASKPLVMFIGLNPSTANESSDDPTIRRVIAISKNLGFGGVYMMNLFAFVSTDPKALLFNQHEKVGYQNNNYLKQVSQKCDKVFFAWGNFEVNGRDTEVISMFPNAFALFINKNGSPKHPLYCKADIQPVPFSNQKTNNKT